MSLNHRRPCFRHHQSTCLEQSSSRSAPIPDIYYFQNTPEVTSVQFILSFSLTVLLTIIDYFCTEPLRLFVLHASLNLSLLHYITYTVCKCNMLCALGRGRLTFAKHGKGRKENEMPADVHKRTEVDLPGYSTSNVLHNG